MYRGTMRHRVDRRDHSFHRTFPRFGALTPATLSDRTYSYDAGLTMPNQLISEPPLTERAYHFGCTGFSTCDMCQNEDRVIYMPGYVYENTCTIEGHEPNQGCDMRNSMKAVTVFGLRKLNGGTAEDPKQALLRKRGKYYIVDKAPGRDWFDSFRIALRANASRRTGISTGTMWFKEWTNGFVGEYGILTPNFVYDGNPNHYPWHDYVISGEVVIANVPYLEIKSWQGKNIGVGGFLRMGREAFNRVYDVYGTIALIPGLAVSSEDVEYVQLTLLQQALDFLNRFLKILRMRVPNYA